MTHDDLQAFFGATRKIRLRESEREEIRSILAEAMETADIPAKSAVRGAAALRPSSDVKKDMFLQTGKNLTLSDQELQDGKNLLRAFMDEHPVRKGPDIQDLWNVICRLPALAAIAGILVVTTLGGVAFAAEDALPGDALYPFKLHVTEPVIEFFAFEGGAVAKRRIWFLERRLVEAEQLHALGRTTHHDDEWLAEEVERQYVRALEVVEADPQEERRADLARELESVLDRHARTLNRESPVERLNVTGARVIRRVEEVRRTARSVRREAEAALPEDRRMERMRERVQKLTREEEAQTAVREIEQALEEGNWEKAERITERLESMEVQATGQQEVIEAVVGNAEADVLR